MNETEKMEKEAREKNGIKLKEEGNRSHKKIIHKILHS